MNDKKILFGISLLSLVISLCSLAGVFYLYTHPVHLTPDEITVYQEQLKGWFEEENNSMEEANNKAFVENQKIIREEVNKELDKVYEFMKSR